MTSLLEFRERIKKIYAKNEVFILPVIKFLVALIVFAVMNGQMGYMSKIDNVAIVLIVSLACSFLPTGFIVFFAALFSLLHLYAMSLEVAVIGFAIYLVILLLYLRFAPKDALIVALVPVLFVMKLPYIVPIVMGLVGGPMSAVSVATGVIVYYVLGSIVSNEAAIKAMSDDPIGRVRLVLDAILGNKAMVVTVVAFALTTAIVYIIRRLSIDHSWSIAIVTGIILNLILMLVGDLIYDTNLSVLGLLFGSMLAALVGIVVQFFRFCVDYGRTEHVQYEDDEYYYYVKAVPKMAVAKSSKTVKKINAQRVDSRRHVEPEETAPRRANKNTMTIGNEYWDDEYDEEEDLIEELEDDFEDLF